MYNLKDTKYESTSQAYFQAGITENVEITAVTLEKSDNNGNLYVKFTFTDSAGAELNIFEWELNKEDAKFDVKSDAQGKRFRHILNRYLTEEEMPVASTYEEFGQKVVSLLTPRIAGKKLRVKIVYNSWNGKYLELPFYPPFMEDMTVDKTDSRLRITDRDKVVKDTADTESDVTSQLSTPAAAAVGTTTDDLPF